MGHKNWLEVDADAVKSMAQQLPRINAPLSGFSPEDADTTLKVAHEQLFVVTPTLQQIILGLLGVARAHMNHVYPGEKAFAAGVQAAEVPLPKHGKLIWLTGLAGAGKTALVEAFARVLRGLMPESDDVSGIGRLGIVPAWHLVVGDRKSEKEVLQALNTLGVELEYDSRAIPEGQRIRPTHPNSVPELIRIARRRIYRDRMLFAMISEFQFVTMSASANARLTGLLLNLRKLGNPCLIDANFSLGHRLLKRNHEELDRLFESEPIVLQPSAPDSNDWRITLKAFLDVSPDSFDLDLERDAEEIHSLCGGINRYVGRLIRKAYALARDRGERVGMVSLRAAYKSTKFSNERATLAEIRRIAEGIPSKRRDLICPFEVPASEQTTRRQKAEEDTIGRFRSIFAQQALTSEERRLVSELQTAMSRKGRTKHSSVVPIKRKSQPITLETLRAAENRRLEGDK